MLDGDLKYINTFPHAEILSSVNNSLVIHAAGINDDELSAVETHLIFSQLESVHAVQQKFDIQSEVEEIAEDDLNLLEKQLAGENDEFDPMAV